jgi:hypothetical protein
MDSEIYLPWGDPAEWHEANQTMKYLIRLHRSALNRAAAKAAEIQRLLASEIFPLMDELCLLTCPHCPDPCCLKATVWIDFQDMLFLNLSGQMIPPRQLMKARGETCAYLGIRGCTLPRMSRAWTCTRYMCPPQTAILRKRPSAVQDAFGEAIQAVKQARRDIEGLFISALSGLKKDNQL